MNCCQSDGIERKFDRANANKQLRRLRRRGPAPNTHLLVEALGHEGVAGASLLDIGGGVGTIHHLLLDAGVREAIHVDISDSYLDVAREEAARRGHRDVRFIHADFVAEAPQIPATDIVTMDRVICCYPDMDSLVGAAAGKTRRLLGAVYPREVWWVRAAIACTNAVQRAKRSAFRLYLHSPGAIEAKLQAAGLTRVVLRKTIFWEIAVFKRAAVT